jgi:hypothetical protein
MDGPNTAHIVHHLPTTARLIDLSRSEVRTAISPRSKLPIDRLLRNWPAASKTAFLDPLDAGA